MVKPNDQAVPGYVFFVEILKIFFFLYCFLVSIDLMGMAFKSHKEFAETFMVATSNPFVSLVIGIVVTSIIQSSSTTTSMIVVMVGAGTLPLANAIPMIMGANIGTTVTNTIVSFGYAGRKIEFERSFSAAIVHDMFNIYATLIIFPLELYTGVILKVAIFLQELLVGMGGLKFVNPLKLIIRPVSEPLAGLLGNHYIMLAVALAGLFFAMSRITSVMRGIVMDKVERILNKYLFKNAFMSLLFGMVLTATVQSSSIATSLIIPIVGAGMLTMEQVFPYTLGANIGTTITAMLAALTVGVEAAVTVAFAHLFFNVLGISLLYPLKAIPIWTANTIAGFVSKSKKNFLIFAIIYILLHIVPIAFAVFTN
jgi:solute carrier family 34 (sodium-dependent phosphate cotransporter)